MKYLLTIAAALIARVLDLFPDPRAFKGFEDQRRVNWKHLKKEYGHAR